jgi:hypothetical protein
MIGHEDARTLDVWLATGEPLEFERVQQEIDLAKEPALKERYGIEPREMYADSVEPHDHARALFAAARKIFEKDGYHITVIILMRDGKPATVPSEMRPGEHGHKYMMMRDLAREAQRIGADAAVLISESWTAPFDPAKPYMRAADAPNRRELLTATVVSKAGEPLYLTAEILRDKEKVSLGETFEYVGGSHYAFAPFYEVWGKKIPPSWVAEGRSADSTEKQ